MRRDNYNIDDCVHCGNCKALCPTYAEKTTELMSARGRIALLQRFQRGELKASGKMYESLFSCILCGACGNSCPVGINITDAVYNSRKNLRGFDKKRLLLDYIIKFALWNPAVSFRLLKLLRIVSNIPFSHRLPPFGHIKKLSIKEAVTPFRVKDTVFRARHAQGRIAIFTGCLVNFMYPTYGRALLRVLNALRFDVILPAGEVCCGAPMLELGMEEDAIRMATFNIQTFKNLNVEAIIALCPTCIHFIRNIYKRLIADSLDNALDVTEFFKERIPHLISEGASKHLFFWGHVAKSNSTAVYHDPCHSRFSLNLYDEPRNIIRSAGFNLIEPSLSGCCGLGGSFGFFHKGLSERMLQNRLESYKDADVVITSCPSCILQLKSKISNCDVMHIVEVIEKVIMKEHQ